MTDRKKPGWAFWAAVAVLSLPVLYVLSFGPACWISSHTNYGASAIPTLYRPIVSVFWTNNRTLKAVVVRYSRAASASGWSWSKFLNEDADDWEFVWMKTN